MHKTDLVDNLLVEVVKTFELVDFLNAVDFVIKEVEVNEFVKLVEIAFTIG